MIKFSNEYGGQMPVWENERTTEELSKILAEQEEQSRAELAEVIPSANVLETVREGLSLAVLSVVVDAQRLRNSEGQSAAEQALFLETVTQLAVTAFEEYCQNEGLSTGESVKKLVSKLIYRVFLKYIEK